MVRCYYYDGEQNTKEYQSWPVVVNFSWRILEGSTEGDWDEHHLTEELKFLQGRGASGQMGLTARRWSQGQA